MLRSISSGGGQKGYGTITKTSPLHQYFCSILFTFQINWLDYFETLFEGIWENARQLFEKGEPIMIKNVKQLEATLKVVSEVSRQVFSMLMYNFEIQTVMFQ